MFDPNSLIYYPTCWWEIWLFFLHRLWKVWPPQNWQILVYFKRHTIWYRSKFYAHLIGSYLWNYASTLHTYIFISGLNNGAATIIGLSPTMAACASPLYYHQSLYPTFGDGRISGDWDRRLRPHQQQCHRCQGQQSPWTAQFLWYWKRVTVTKKQKTKDILIIQFNFILPWAIQIIFASQFTYLSITKIIFFFFFYIIDNFLNWCLHLSSTLSLFLYSFLSSNGKFG